MHKVLGFLGSLAVALLVTAAGLVLDAKTLTYGGVLLLALVAILWLYNWSRFAPGRASESRSKDEQIFTRVRDACAAAAAALRLNDPDRIHFAFPPLDSAIASVAKRWGIARPALPADPASALRVGIEYLDQICPYLQGGHVDDATRLALAFVRKHGVYRLR